MADFIPPKIEEEIGILSESKSGWKLELNLVSWNERPAKYDLRSWDESHAKMGKGVTMNKEELKNLKSILNALEL